MKPLDATTLRWSCERPAFNDTRDVTPAQGVVGQDHATDALHFGLAVHAKGHNVFVRGAAGTGRLTLVREVLSQVEPQSPAGLDRLYVLDPDAPDSPKLISVAPGTGRRLKERLDELIRFIREDLVDLAQTESLIDRTHELESVADVEVGRITGPFEAAIAQAGLAVVTVEDEDGDEEPAVVPIIDDEPVHVQQLGALVVSGAMSAEAADALRQVVDLRTQELRRLSVKVTRIRKRTHHRVQRLVREEVQTVLADAVADLRRDVPEVRDWLDKVVEEVPRVLPVLRENPEVCERYRANLLVARNPSAPRPTVFVTNPTFQSLVGSVDSPGEGPPHLGIHAGSILEADGGYLVLDANDIVGEPGAWSALTRTLKANLLDLSPQDPPGTTQRAPGVKPEPIPVHVKVVLIGTPGLYYGLDDADADFSELFKVLADFDDVIVRDRTGLKRYAEVLAGMAKRGGLPPFTSNAVAALCEQGARIAASRDKLTARFGRINDVAREAAFIARRRQVEKVHREDVEDALQAAVRRADLPGRHFRERVADGNWRIDTRGEVTGQINGLAVIHAGPQVYGFPSRITASVGPGLEGAVHVEREAELSGQIHTKGFYILKGALRNLLATEHPLIFDASITHEQSYGGIDGDSASGAELCALVSALTGLPARQGLAMTGAIDQLGNVLPIGAVNEKIEGFFDTCAAVGLTGEQGVLVPSANVGDLNLRRDVVEACRAGRFAVYGVDHIHEAMALFLSTDIEAIVATGRALAEGLWSVTRPPS